MDARRIRVFFSDPDATDSDSGDDPTSGPCAATKSAAGKTEILILHGNTKKNPDGCGGRAQATIGSPVPAARIGKRAVIMSSAPARRHRGVYERQPGRWAAEFRSHRLKVRHWVGTFATEAAAKAAYDAFERDFLSSPRRARPPAPESDGNGGGGRGVLRTSRPPPDDKPQIVLALAAATIPGTTRMMQPVDAMAASVTAAPCVSSSTSAGAMAASSVSSSMSASPPPPALFQDAARPHEPSVHSFWADEPDLVGLADLSHLSLPLSGANMDFDPADLELFDNGFL
ncbi:unnamed protein product [Urochloa humidicola]